MTNKAPEIRNNNSLQKLESNTPNDHVLHKINTILSKILESQQEGKLTIIIQPTARKNLRISLESSIKTCDHWSIPMT